MTSRVTQCPKCYTSFRVTASQLEVANGAVRCGSCLHIFNAPEHWIQSPEAPASEESSLFEEQHNTSNFDSMADTNTESYTRTTEPSALNEREDLLSQDIEQDLIDDIFDDDIFADDDIDLLADELLAEQASEPDPAFSNTEIEAPTAPETAQQAESDDFDFDGLDLDDLDAGTLELDSVALQPPPPNPQPFDTEYTSGAESFHQDSTEPPHQHTSTSADDLDNMSLDSLILDDASPELDDDLSDASLDDLVLEDLDDQLDISSSHLNKEEALTDTDELISDTMSQSIMNTEDDLLLAVDDTNLEKAADGGFSDSFLELDFLDSDAGSVFRELDDIGDDSPGEDEEAWAKKLLDDELQEEEQDPWESSLLDDKDTTTSAPSPRTERPAARDNFDDLFDNLDDEPLELDPALEDILNVRSAETPTKAAHHSHHDHETPAFSDGWDDTDAADDNAHYEQPNPPAEEEIVLAGENLTAGDRIGSNNLELLDHIEPETLELDAGQDRQPWIKRAWIASIVLAVLLLASQYFNYNFDRLARDEGFRPVLASTCSLFGCQLPALDDVSQIRSSNLIVRSHPRVANALIVDAILINRADFNQPFPIMELQFTNLAGKPVAGRRFLPNEYLAGELSGGDQMPSRQPIHVSLEIVDPGKTAVNYQLHFQPHRDS